MKIPKKNALSYLKDSAFFCVFTVYTVYTLIKMDKGYYAVARIVRPGAILVAIHNKNGQGLLLLIS